MPLDPNKNGQTHASVDESVLLTESAVEDIEIAYVRQGDRAYVALGDVSASDIGEGVELVENITDLDTTEVMVEGVDGKRPMNFVKDGTWVVEGIFQRADTVNVNKRKYSRKLWERVLSEDGPTMRNIRERSMIGQVEHPADGRSNLKLAALLVTSNKLREDGIVWGTAELLNTPDGMLLQALSEAKIKWGISSRGRGRVDGEGNVDEERFTLGTYDAVSSPSTPGAFPSAKRVKSASRAKGTNESVTLPDVPDFEGLSEDDQIDLARDFLRQFATATGETEVADTLDGVWKAALRVPSVSEGDDNSADLLVVNDNLRVANRQLVAELAERKNATPTVNENTDNPDNTDTGADNTDTDNFLDDGALDDAVRQNLQLQERIEAIQTELGETQQALDESVASSTQLTSLQLKVDETRAEYDDLVTLYVEHRDQVVAYLLEHVPALQSDPEALGDVDNIQSLLQLAVQAKRVAVTEADNSTARMPDNSTKPSLNLGKRCLNDVEAPIGARQAADAIRRAL